MLEVLLMRTLLRIFGTLFFLGIFVYQMFFAYGSEVDFGNGNSVYYTKGATKEQAQQLGDALVKLEFFSSGPASVQVARQDDLYLIRFVTIDSAWTDADMQKAFAEVGHSLAEEVFPGQKVRIELCDDSFETKVSLEPKAPVIAEGESTEFGNVTTFGQNSVYYKAGISPEEAQKAGQALVEMEYFSDGTADVQLLKDGETYVVRFVTGEQVWSDEEAKKDFATVGWGLADSAFPQKDVRIELCDDHLRTKAAFPPQAPAE